MAELSILPGTGGEIACHVTVHDDLHALEAEWRAFEQRAVATPYQRFDWIAAYAGTLAAAANIRIVVARGADGAIDVILPLELVRGAGMTTATIPGGKHANFHMPLLSERATAMGAPAIRSMLRAAAEAMKGLDAFSFVSQPATWHGSANPFAAVNARPGASLAHAAMLDRKPEAALQRILSKDARKKLRWKARKLEELGPVSHAIARTPDEIARVLAVFLKQKEDRFREMNIDNPFSGKEMGEFLHRAAQGSGGDAPALALHYIACGERIAAIFGIAMNRYRASGMFISFNPDADIARASPGDLIVAQVMEHYGALGVEGFDLGLGEARYKETFCDIVEPVYDAVIPLTAKGHAFAVTSQAVLAAKRELKRHPALLALVRGALRKAS